MAAAVATAVSSRKKQQLKYMYRDKSQIEMRLLTTCSRKLGSIPSCSAVPPRELRGGGGGVEGKLFPPSPFLHSPSTCKDEYRAYVTINFKILLLTRKI